MSRFRACRTVKIKLLGLIPLVPLVILCDRYLDLPLAIWIKAHIYRNPVWYPKRVPDLLLQLVLLVTVTALSLYLVRSKKGLFDRLTFFLKETSWVAPASFLAKAALKPIFGRVNTSLWLQHPELYGFHWFTLQRGYDAFPSGHMIVVVAIFASMGRHYPRSRAVATLVSVVLGVLLMGTSYHFLSDVIAGAYLGVVTEALVFHLLDGEPRPVAVERAL